MHTLLSNLTAAMLVIHAVIGCCHHHWHSAACCEVECSPLAVFETGFFESPTCDCCHHDCQSHEESDLPTDPCDGEAHCSGVCTYLPTPKTVIDAPLLVVSFDAVAIAATQLDSRLLTAIDGGQPPDGRLNSRPALRLHLLHQIILI